ncbi:hypothetical protein E5676_scaffold552G00200 [Cucumis melo var. makuwa]|uniref:Uncharacterized protein n=1 Tax=Cucumis melo var. makuwa TaxID=1194695 RepID=A0A5D3CSY6_CUCMM|nr:hypothetical protein E5676_scaffold552G00200 [Cucumis melo var. makuwa]
MMITPRALLQTQVFFIKELLTVLVASVSHNPQSTSKDTNNNEDYEEGGGEYRATNDNPEVDVVDSTVVLLLDVDQNNIEVGQEESMVPSKMSGSLLCL